MQPEGFKPFVFWNFLIPVNIINDDNDNDLDHDYLDFNSKLNKKIVVHKKEI